MPGNTFGLPIPIDGPAPLPPALTLVGAARLVPTDDDRWIQGGAIWPYPRDLPDVFDPCQPSSSAGHSKDKGTPTTPTGEEFGAYNVVEGVTCTTRGAFSQDPGEVKRRVEVALKAYEHWAIEREFWSAALKPDNPHLAQTTGLTLNVTTSNSIKSAVAQLEQHIADKGGTGFIHMRVDVFSQWVYESPCSVEVDRGVARTKLGTIVVPGVGYPGSAPDGTPAAGLVSTIYATGPVEHRQSEIKILPDELREAALRTQNEVTFRAERYVLDTFDQRIHAAVKVDRALTYLTI